MDGTLLLGQKSYIRDIIHTSSKIAKFCQFYRGSKSHIGKFLILGRDYHKYETEYILEVWEKDCHLKKRYIHMQTIIQAVLLMSVFEQRLSF